MGVDLPAGLLAGLRPDRARLRFFDPGLSCSGSGFPLRQRHVLRHLPLPGAVLGPHLLDRLQEQRASGIGRGIPTGAVRRPHEGGSMLSPASRRLTYSLAFLYALLGAALFFWPG